MKGGNPVKLLRWPVVILLLIAAVWAAYASYRRTLAPPELWSPASAGPPKGFSAPTGGGSGRRTPAPAGQKHEASDPASNSPGTKGGK